MNEWILVVKDGEIIRPDLAMWSDDIPIPYCSPSKAEVQYLKFSYEYNPSLNQFRRIKK